jgi:hypothetical protein
MANVSSATSVIPNNVVYGGGSFFCDDNTMDSYQWGVEDILTLDSTILSGEVNQFYRNTAPEFSRKLYWVITTKNGCTAKTYYRNPTGIINVNETVASLNVYPNPTDGIVTLEVGGISGAQMEASIVDMTGKVVATGALENNKAAFNVGNVASGVYIINCYSEGNKVGSVRFIKN